MFRKTYFYFAGTDTFAAKYRELKLLEGNKTIKQLVAHPKSLVRFGDGEMELMLGSSVYYQDWHQKYDPLLAKRLREIFQTKDIYKGIVLKFLTPSDAELKSKGLLFIWCQMRCELWKHLNPDETYLDAHAFRENPGIDLGLIFSFVKTRQVVFVNSSEESFAKLKKAVPSAQFIQAPKSNAWLVYPQLLKQTLDYAKKNKLDKKKALFLCSVGPAAKPMIVDLTKEGYLAWDTGYFFEMSVKA